MSRDVSKRVNSRLAVLSGVVVLLLSLLVAQVAQAQPAPATHAAAGAGAASLQYGGSPDRLVGTQGVVMAPGVVVVSQATVAANLIAVSDDGSTLVFKSAAGTLAQLAPGKVMLLQGYTAGVVSTVAHTGGHLVVTSQPATLTDIFKTADLSFTTPVDFSNVFETLDPGTPVSDGSDDSSEVRRVGPDLVRGMPEANPYPKLGLSYTGTGKGGFAYKVSVTPTPSTLDWEVLGCVGASISGSNCSSRSTGLQVEATLKGSISSASIKGQLDMLNGRNVNSSFTLSSKGAVDFSYKVIRGDTGSKVFKLPAFRFPVTFNIPIILFDVPMLLKVQLSALVTIALSSNNSTVQGGVNLTYDGPQGATEAGSSDSPIGTTTKLIGSFVNNLRSITLSSAGLELATQMKIGFGPGFSAASFLGYVDVVTALGQVTPTLVAGLPCSKYYLNVSGSAYFEVQLGSFKGKLPVSNFSIPEKQTTAQC